MTTEVKRLKFPAVETPDGIIAKDISDYVNHGIPLPVVEASPAIVGEIVEYSDDHIASDFVRVHGDSFRYTGAEHNQWLYWDGTRWVRDEKLHRFSKAREVCRSIAQHINNDSQRRSVTSASKVNAIVELSRSDSRISLDKDTLDSDPLALNTPSGTINLQTGEKSEHSSTDYITKITRFSPAPGHCPVFEQFLKDIFIGDEQMIDFIQIALGYCLTGIIREQVFFFAHGGGKNGKSTLFDVIEEIVGGYGNNLSATALMSQRSSQHSTDIAMLEGVRIAFTTELDKSQRWNIPVLKALTGNQRIAARKMHQDAGSFPNRVKLIISGNDLPSFEGGDAAMERRILLLPFNAYFSEKKRDRQMADKLIAEAPQILHWIITGAVRYFSEGLSIPEAVKSSSRRYFEEMDTVKQWADSCLRKLDGEFTSSTELIEHYSEWAQDKSMTVGEFKKHMTRLGFTHKRTKKARGFGNVKIMTEFDLN